MTGGGSFIFSLTSPTSETVKIGSVAMRQGQGQVSPGVNEKIIRADGGFHFSLHPPSKINPSIGNSAHIRSNAAKGKKGAIHDSVITNWFPVDTPRHIMNFYTAPMDKLVQTTKTAHFKIPVVDTHSGSLRGKVDFYPRNTEAVTRYKSCFNEIHAFSPYYRILISLYLHAAIEPCIIYPIKIDGL